MNVDSAGRFLLSRGLIDAAEIVEGGLRIVDASRRNLNLRVLRPGGRGYLIKQADPMRRESAATLSREGAFYRFCRDAPRAAPLRALLPCVAAAGGEDGTLVLELLEDAVPLWPPEPPDHAPEVARPLGEGLRRLHTLFRGSQDARLAGLPRTAPSVLWIDKPGVAALEELSPAQTQVLALLQHRSALAASLSDLRGAWRADGLIHGDLRSDNVLVSHGGRRVRLVDWELVQWGDASWDVGSVMADALLAWLLSIPWFAAGAADDPLDAARRPLGVVQTFLQRFWSGYGLAAPEATPFLTRAARFAAARLLQSAYERSAGLREPANSVLATLQVGVNLLADPDAAFPALLGISQSASLPGRRG